MKPKQRLFSIIDSTEIQADWPIFFLLVSIGHHLGYFYIRVVFHFIYWWGVYAEHVAPYWYYVAVAGVLSWYRGKIIPFLNKEQ